jgi:hypothetical protein
VLRLKSLVFYGNQGYTKLYSTNYPASSISAFILWTVPMPTLSSLAILWIPRSPFHSARRIAGPAEPLTFGPRLREPFLDPFLRRRQVLAYKSQECLCEVTVEPACFWRRLGGPPCTFASAL